MPPAPPTALGKRGAEVGAAPEQGVAQKRQRLGDSAPGVGVAAASEEADAEAARVVGAAALAQLDRTEEAKTAAGMLMDHHPTLNVERHLRNFHWKRPEDLAHYRDGLIKAGVPRRKLVLIQSDVRRAAES